MLQFAWKVKCDTVSRDGKYCWNCQMGLVDLESAIWSQLMNSEWIYFAWYSDCVVTLWGKVDLFDSVLQATGKLRINFECKRIYQFCIITKLLYSNEWCKVKKRRFTDTKLHQRNCCDVLCLQFNVDEFYLDVK
jgi:hypothetical protein